MKTLPALLLLLSTSLAALAADEPDDDTVKQTDTQETPDTTPENKKKSSEPVPEADRLKQRELGDAFRRFVPSEAISSDNAVPFPVDI